MDDWGLSLVANRFAFGLGNPDFTASPDTVDLTDGSKCKKPLCAHFK